MAVTDRRQKPKTPKNRPAGPITERKQLDPNNPNQRRLLGGGMISPGSENVCPRQVLVEHPESLRQVQ